MSEQYLRFTRTRRSVLEDITDVYEEPSQSTSNAILSIREVARISSTSSSTSSFVHSSERKRTSAALEDDESNRTPNCSTMSEETIMRPDVTTFYRTPGVFKYRRRASLVPQIDYFEYFPVPNECVLNIFRFLNKRDLNNAMKTCQRFYSVGQASELWHSIDASNRSLNLSDVFRVIGRGCKVLRLCGTTVLDDKSSAAVLLEYDFSRLRLTHLDLSRCNISCHAIETILKGCSYLQAVSLENCEITKHASIELSRNRGLTHVDFSMTRGLDEETICYILPCLKRLCELNMSWCELSTAAVKAVIETVSPTIRRINLSGTLDKRAIQDSHVATLVARCPLLAEVDLSDSSELTRCSLTRLLSLRNLETLSLSRCFAIHPMSYLQCINISQLNIFGCVTDEGEATLRQRLAHTAINGNPFSHIARPTPPPSVTSIWGMKTKDLY